MENFKYYWQWWLHELDQLLPNWFKTLFYPYHQQQIFFRFENFQAHIFSFNSGAEVKIGQFFLHKEGARQLEALFEQHTEWLKAEKILLLNAKQVLRRNISLPIAAQSELNQVVAYELDKYVPLIREHAYFATQILGKNKENNQIYAELVCLPRTKLDHYYQEFYDWGLVLDAICYDYGVEYFKSQAQSKKHNLLPEHLIPKRSYLARRLTQVFAAIFSLLLIAVVVYPLWLQSNRISELQQQVSEAKRKSDEVDKLKAQSDVILSAAHNLNDLKHHAPVLINAIQELTLIVPDDTWLKSLDYSDNKLLLEGLSGSSSALIGLLEDSDFFSQTRFVSPVMQDSSAGQDMFKLETHVDGDRVARLH